MNVSSVAPDAGRAAGRRRLYACVRAVGPSPSPETERTVADLEPLDGFWCGLCTEPVDGPLPEAWLRPLRAFYHYRSPDDAAALRVLLSSAALRQAVAAR